MPPNPAANSDSLAEKTELERACAQVEEPRAAVGGWLPYRRRRLFRFDWALPGLAPAGEGQKTPSAGGTAN